MSIPTVFLWFVKLYSIINNYLLIQKFQEFGKTLGEELLTPTRLYPKAVLPLIEQELVKGMVHITGGGFL